MKLACVVLAIICAAIVAFGFDTGDLGPLKVLAAGVAFAAIANVVP